MLVTFKEQMHMLHDAKNALFEIKRKKNIPSTIELLTETFKRSDKGRYLFESYDRNSYKEKMKVDILFYEHLLKNLDSNYVKPVEDSLDSLYFSIRELYEFVNIKPQVFGKGINVNILNESISSANNKIHNAIYEHLDKTFYSLTPEQRCYKYYDIQKPLSFQLINEGTNVEDSITFAIKTTITEGLLKDIAFPFSVWSRITYLAEDADYSKLFDRNKLLNLIENYLTKTHNLAKIIATCI